MRLITDDTTVSLDPVDVDRLAECFVETLPDVQGAQVQLQSHVGPGAPLSLRLPEMTFPRRSLVCSAVSESAHGSPDSTETGKGTATVGAPP